MGRTNTAKCFNWNLTARGQWSEEPKSMGFQTRDLFEFRELCSDCTLGYVSVS